MGHLSDREMVLTAIAEIYEIDARFEAWDSGDERLSDTDGARRRTAGLDALTDTSSV